ncbi:hypothetical protein Scep_008044 [Stephania cephalantha]|uniref:Aquaporin n=1 Tax=Stephania cephalantha TaxID=152367 RepID=A0AAP0PMC3_9MAGN
MAKLALGSAREATQSDCVRALIAEFICTFLFVFAGVGAAMTANKMSADPLLGLFAVAVAHALVVAVMISAGLHTSGGHLNPAVTIGLFFGGHITLFRSILYWIDQLLASSLACILLKYLTGGLETPAHTLASGVGPLQGVIWEILLTFSLLYTVYATLVDPKKGALDGLGPTLTGFVRHIDVDNNTTVGKSKNTAECTIARSRWKEEGDEGELAMEGRTQLKM